MAQHNIRNLRVSVMSLTPQPPSLALRISAPESSSVHKKGNKQYMENKIEDLQIKSI